MNYLIKKYIDKLTINDVNNFALKNDIILNDQELSLIYNIIKNDYNKLLSKDYDKVFNKLKDNVSYSNYEKIVSLFKKYEKEYGHLL